MPVYQAIHIKYFNLSIATNGIGIQCKKREDFLEKILHNIIAI